MSAWAASRLPGVLGRLGPGQARSNRDRECGKGQGLSREELSTDLRGGSFMASTTDGQSCQATKGTCLFCKDLSAFESAWEDDPALDGPEGKHARPLPSYLQPPKAFAPKTGVSCRPRDLEDCRWPMETGLVFPPWDTQLPGPPSMSKAEDTDPNNLTALDLRGGGIMRVTSWYIAYVHQFLLTLLESQYLGTFSQGTPVRLPGHVLPRPVCGRDSSIRPEGGLQHLDTRQGKEWGIFHSPRRAPTGSTILPSTVDWGHQDLGLPSQNQGRNSVCLLETGPIGSCQPGSHCLDWEDWGGG